jgi:protein-S-isoprenylcysteine O-methyltransferase Ste14
MGRLVLDGAFFLGSVIVYLSALLLDHFELLGLRQAVSHFLGRPEAKPALKTSGIYRLVRHPLMLGLFMVFWASPRMTAGHLLFAVAMTLYILIGTMLEEKDLIRHFGNVYLHYIRRVPRYFPRIPRRDRRCTR